MGGHSNSGAVQHRRMPETEEAAASGEAPPAEPQLGAFDPATFGTAVPDPPEGGAAPADPVPEPEFVDPMGAFDVDPHEDAELKEQERIKAEKKAAAEKAEAEAK